MINIFMTHRAFYDAKQPANASLYIFAESGAVAEAMSYVLRLEEAGLWTSGGIAEVKASERELYAHQLETVDIVMLKSEGCLAGQFSHPKYKSDGARWLTWKKHLLR